MQTEGNSEDRLPTKIKGRCRVSFICCIYEDVDQEYIL